MKKQKSTFKNVDAISSIMRSFSNASISSMSLASSNLNDCSQSQSTEQSNKNPQQQNNTNEHSMDSIYGESGQKENQEPCSNDLISGSNGQTGQNQAEKKQTKKVTIKF